MKIFKEAKRFDVLNLPALGQACFYSPCIQLTLEEYKPVYRKSDLFPWLRPFAPCKVVGLTNKEHLVIVKFPRRKETDLVSPEFLMKRELTKEGKELFEKH